jgi:predicted ATPase
MSDERRRPGTNNQRSHAAADGRIVSVKQIAHELGLDVRLVRHVLRARYKPASATRRVSWQWSSPREIAEVRRYLARTLGRQP